MYLYSSGWLVDTVRSALLLASPRVAALSLLRRAVVVLLLAMLPFATHNDNLHFANVGLDAAFSGW